MTISVIIATYNRSADLRRCLDALLQQQRDESFSFEIVIADNNSQDNTREAAAAYRERFPDQIRYVLETKQGKCHALNTAIGSVNGDVIAFIDDDARPDPQWLYHLARCFNENRCDGVGGRVLPMYPARTPDWVKENISLLAGPIVVYDYGTETRVYEKPAYEFLGTNMAFKRQVFEECGLFRTDIGPGRLTFGDDTEFVNRVLKAGKKLFYCGQVLVHHPVNPGRMNLKYIARWNIALGRYRVIVDQEGKLDMSLLYYFGIPRYLIREMMGMAGRLLLNVFKKKEFLRRWVLFFRDWGRAMEMRKIYYTINTGTS